MIKSIKNAAILGMALSFAAVGTACTQEKPDAQVQEKTLAMNANTNNSVKDLSGRVIEIKAAKAAKPGKAVDFTFMKDGKETSFAELTKGKVVFLNFWGTWCPPCRAEIPDIIQISKDLKDKPFIVIGVALENNKEVNASMDNVYKFSESKDIPYMNYIPNDAIKAVFRDAYGGLKFVPTTVIIDKDGNIAETLVGGRDKAAFMEAINKVLK